MRAGDAASNLSEELRHDLDELHRLHDIEDLLQFVEEHDLLWTVHLGPVLEEAYHHLAVRENQGEREEKKILKRDVDEEGEEEEEEEEAEEEERVEGCG